MDKIYAEFTNNSKYSTNKKILKYFSCSANANGSNDDMTIYTSMRQMLYHT